jgi:cell division protein FtsB
MSYDALWRMEMREATDHERTIMLAKELDAMQARLAEARKAEQRLRDVVAETAARWRALDTPETDDAIRGFARHSLKLIKPNKSDRTSGEER